MQALPYIDTHARRIPAAPEQVWRALLVTLRNTMPTPPWWLATAWGLEPRRRSGVWDTAVESGESVPGFAVDEVAAPRLLRLRGRHRFSDYELRFELEPIASGGTRLSARSSAAFPGVTGRIYRTLVIDSGGHRVAVGRILARVARRAGCAAAAVRV